MEKHRSLARFGLRTTLVVMFVFASLFASYRYGFNRGRTLGPLVPTSATADTVYAREYDVSDLITSESDADLVIDGLRKTVEPTSWVVVGGFAEIQFNADSVGFIVVQTWPGHVSVVRYLSFLREHATGQQNWPELLDFAQRNQAAP